MKIALEIIERVNLGNYEFAELKASIEFDSDEATGDPAIFGQEKLDSLLLPHRRRALSLIPEDINSFMVDHPALER
ncbi:hypothetical protein [Streptomyces tubercidicus]|uniref:hypothetical protein n=1 Tax=Streptomyces tubercidicus TaxID=47759 RepID=UPI00368CF1D7